ncbi:radical SAM/SPASM domain-containing protein [Clostridium botulinum]|uniref:Radical SAM n=4 Tax=Clostridium botulinum TaxID=1491 RepID=C1FUB5_CLOBJ|nr:radical SAM protein [Clostridium botulinum]ACO85378.1 radical SAM [Clostridium botulinum A2 str. Kyoto]AUN07860.1 radical SAM protein [Clostridium botulinum]MBN3365184.1 radical SAM protein [Clostridium botulinum]MBN3370618.1 radical SAM protein [Clostridium botulinum]MBN3372561.1 radical SAM protein [Clostridium botulinum]
MSSLYKFKGRLKEEFPSQIIVDVAEICNLACVHCPHSQYQKSGKLSGNFIDVELNSKMVNEVEKYGKGNTQQIRYTANGETLLHPQIYEMLKYSVDNSGTFVSVTTNGTLLNGGNIEKLLGTGVNLIDISIDAFLDETYSKIRRNGELKITRNNVLNLLNMKNTIGSKTKIVVSFVEQKLNKNEVINFKEYWESKGADYVIIRRLHSAGGANDNIADDIKSVNKNRRPCVYPWERITLNAKGYLSYCPDCWDGKSEINDYRSNNIYETWNSTFYKELREAHVKNKLSLFQFCNQCPDWAQTRWPEEGRGYGDMISDFSKSDNK